MDIYEAIRARKSVRAFRDREIEEEKLNRVLDAARLAPSARNGQEWRYVVVRDPETRQRLVPAANGQVFVGNAPAVLACCAETDGRVMSCGQPAYTIDVAIATDHLTLAAAAEGLGTCWIGAFDEEKVKEILDIPKQIRVVQLMVLGYPEDPSIVQKNRLPFDRIVRYERW